MLVKENRMITTFTPSQDRIWPNKVSGFSWVPIPGTNPKNYQLASIFTGFPSAVTKEHPKGDVTRFDSDTVFPVDFVSAYGKAPVLEFFEQTKEDILARDLAQRLYTADYSRYRGPVDGAVEFGDKAAEIQDVLDDFADAVAPWGLNGLMLFKTSVTEYKAKRMLKAGRVPLVNLRLAFTKSLIFITNQRTFAPFHIDAKVAFLNLKDAEFKSRTSRAALTNAVTNYQIDLIMSGKIVERLHHSLGISHISEENERLKREKAAAEEAIRAAEKISAGKEERGFSLISLLG